MKAISKEQLLEACKTYINDMGVSLEELAAHLNLDNEKLKKKMLRYSKISLPALQRKELFKRLAFDEYFYNGVSLLKIANDQETTMKINIEKRIMEFLLCLQEKDKEKAQDIFKEIAERKEFIIIKMAKYKYEHKCCNIEDLKRSYYNFNDNDIYNVAIKVQEIFKDYFLKMESFIDPQKEDDQIHYWAGRVKKYSYVKIC